MGNKKRSGKYSAESINAVLVTTPFWCALNITHNLRKKVNLYT